MDLDEAAKRFAAATHHCDNLISVHRRPGKGPGRRREEVSLNRAVVVLAVASWQALIQDFVFSIVDLSAPRHGGGMSVGTYNVLAGRLRSEVGNFSTPNAENTRKLLTTAGFDPWPYWTWSQRAGRGRGVVTMTPADAGKRINEWLKLRHSIAHGDAALPQVDVLEAVRLASGLPPTHPELRLTDAEQCLTFFRRLARLTGVPLAGHLGVSPPAFTP